MVGFEHQEKPPIDSKNELDANFMQPGYTPPAFLYPNPDTNYPAPAYEEGFRNWKKDICCWFQNPFHSIISACCCPVILDYKLASKKSMNVLSKIFVAIFILQVILVVGMFSLYIASGVVAHSKHRDGFKDDNVYYEDGMAYEDGDHRDGHRGHHGHHRYRDHDDDDDDDHHRHRHCGFILYKIGDCFFYAILLVILVRCVLHTYLRMKIREDRKIVGSSVSDCCTHLFLGSCALIQQDAELREDQIGAVPIEKA